MMVRRLPAGSVLDVDIPYGPLTVPHPGVLDYAWNGEPVMLHNSKKIGGAAATTMFEFTEGQTPRLTHVPGSSMESARIVQSARFDVARGVRWASGDNCQDFVSRAVTGRNGSPTRDAIIALAILGTVAWLARK